MNHRARLSLFLLILAAALPVVAEAPRIDRKLGEEEEIRMRRAWFLESRMQGVERSADLAALRLSAVEATRSALELQRSRRAAGSERGTTAWIPKGPSPSSFGGWAFGNISGRVSAIAADWAGGKLYVGTASGGLWVSDNDGASYTELLDQAGSMTVGAIAIDPDDPNVLWVGTGENVVSCESYFGIGLLRSVDGGASWEPRNGTTGAELPLSKFSSVIVDPRDSDRLVVGGRYQSCDTGGASDGGLYTTDDGGVSWTLRLTAEIHEIAQDPVVQDTFWAATDNGIYKSTNNAVSWTKQTASGLPSSGTGRTELAIAPSDPDVVYALFGSPNALWQTTDGGLNWTQRASGGNACDGQCFYNMVLRVDPFDPQTIYRGTIRVYRSTNGGLNWSDLTNGWGSSQKVHQDIQSMLMDPNNPDTFYVGSDGGIWKSSNAGASFSNKVGNINATQFYAINTRAEDPETICGGAQDNSSLARTTSNEWTLQQVTGDGFVCAFNSVDTNYAYITSYPSGGYPNVWRSTSGTFGGFGDITGPGSGVSSGDRSNWVTPYILDPLTPSTMYLGTHRVYRSTNRGTNWLQVGPSDLTGGGGNNLKSLEVNRNFTSVIYSGSTDGRIWRSDDGGDNWVDISAGLPGRSINDIGADPTNPDRAFAVVGGFNTDHLWEWNLGVGWTARPGGLPNVPTNTVLVLSDTDVMVGNDVGIFRSFDGGLNFSPYMDGLPLGVVTTDLKYNLQQSVITAGTYGRGAWQIFNEAVDPIVLFDGVELPPVEVDGDGDANIEPGETWAFNARLRNGGGQTATAISATVSTATPGVTIELPAGSFGDLAPGETGTATTAFSFTVAPDFNCGDAVVFDLIDVVSNESIDHGDDLGVASFQVIDSQLTSPLEIAFEDDFDPAPEAGWTHEAINAGVAPCEALPNIDEWKVLSRDAAHGESFHAGNGPGANYTRSNFAWLYYGGKDSENGEGFHVPADALQARLTISHWYQTYEGGDGGQVVIDAIDNDQDVYLTLNPLEGYPAGTIEGGNCSGLEGLPAFHGDSGGWVTNTFDLMPYRGQTVYLAFVFASDVRATTGEGWYVDDIQIETQVPGDPVCQVTAWPGTVPPTLTLDRTGPSADLVASWDGACNAGELPSQSYALHAGSLDALLAGGSYTHAPLDAACDRVSPSPFTAGGGNEYYLVVPVEGSRQGVSGTRSDGTLRPTPDATCGLERAVSCP